MYCTLHGELSRYPLCCAGRPRHAVLSEEMASAERVERMSLVGDNILIRKCENDSRFVTRGVLMFLVDDPNRLRGAFPLPSNKTVETSLRPYASRLYSYGLLFPDNAPETSKEKCGPAADIWCVGTISYILVGGYYPFRGRLVAFFVLRGKLLPTCVFLGWGGWKSMHD